MRFHWVRLTFAPAIAFFVAACTTGYSTNDQQVIYIPTDNGVQTERVSVGSAPGAQSENNTSVHTEGPLNLLDVRRFQRAALESNSTELEYLGSSTEGLFITESFLETDFGYGTSPDGSRLHGLCLAWQDHGPDNLDAGEISKCRAFGLVAKVWREGGWSDVNDDHRQFDYDFDRMEGRCGHYDRECPPYPFTQRVITQFPVCVAVTAHKFRRNSGEEYIVIGNTRAEVYGREGPVALVADPIYSRQFFGRDYSGLDNLENCADFLRENLK